MGLVAGHCLPDGLFTPEPRARRCGRHHTIGPPEVSEALRKPVSPALGPTSTFANNERKNSG